MFPSFTASPLVAGEMLLKLELHHLSDRKRVVIEKLQVIILVFNYSCLLEYK